jgi:hypothetical protein
MAALDGSEPATTSRSLPTFWLVPLSVGILISAYVIAAAVCRYPTVDFLSELTVYRIGNAVSLLFNEKDYVRPVQGLPIALLAKFEIWAMGLVRGNYVMNATTLAVYQGIYFGTLFAFATAALTMAWRAMATVERAAALLLFLSPWLLGGPAISLMIEPDYWAGEWCYLMISLCLLKEQRLTSPWLIGAWIAVGFAMKITLLGIAPLFVLGLSDRSPRALLIVALCFAATFVLTDLVYMGGVRSGLRALEFQLGFFANPNPSAQWPDLRSMLADRPFLIVLGICSIFILATSPASIQARLAGAAWLLGSAYVLWRRPHDTSIASASTAMIFLIAYFVRSRVALTGVAALLVSTAAVTGFVNLRALQSFARNQKATNISYPVGAMIFLPDNYWNAGLAVQAFGYNGQLAYDYPITSADDGHPRYSSGGKAFQALFPDTVMIQDTPYTLNVAETALLAGIPLWWTDRDPMPADEVPGRAERLQDLIKKTGATVETHGIAGPDGQWQIHVARKR